MKNEIDHWSDPDFQISQGKYSPAAKTLMDKTALKYGEDHPELRVVIFNPNGIVGMNDPTGQKRPMAEWSALWMAFLLMKKVEPENGCLDGCLEGTTVFWSISGGCAVGCLET